MPVYENDSDTPLQPGDVEASEELLEDADRPQSTDWDISCENPPYEWWTGAVPHPDLPPGGQKAD
ncbi:hypothetical protein [Cupriavidus sp. CuC1]|uniref:hypothetical protein n=1 Tax=Cupriavidus sp. CuC1 TaxID=3373131 RepID=UPI0037D6D93F